MITLNRKLQISLYTDPTDPNQMVRIFRCTRTALAHIRDHLLTGPECQAWGVVFEVLQGSQTEATRLVSLSSRERQRLSRQIMADEDDATVLYETYAHAIATSLKSTLHTGWRVSRGRNHALFSPLGILVYCADEDTPNDSKKGRSDISTGKQAFQRVVRTAFLPGHGNFQPPKPAPEDPLLRREGTSRARQFDTKQRRLHRLKQRNDTRRNRSIQDQLYRLFRETRRALRRRATDDPGMIQRRSPDAVKLDQDLIESMPSRSRIPAIEWKLLLNQTLSDTPQ